MPRLIEREALNVVQELYKLSAHNYSKVLGAHLGFCDGRTPNIPLARALLVCRSVFAIDRSWWSVVFFCACFVQFERSMKLRETAIEQESLQAAYSLFYGRHLWLGHPHCTMMSV